MFSTTSDTMVMLVSRVEDRALLGSLYTQRYWFVVRLRKSARIALKSCTGMFSNTPDAMAMLVSGVGDRVPLESLYANRFVVR